MVESSAPPLPDLAEADTLLWASRFTGEAARQTAVAEDVLGGWADGAWPAGCRAVSCLPSDDGETVLTVSQWDGAAPEQEGLARFRRYHSLGYTTDRVARCAVTATFDVDGPERQRSFVAAVLRAHDAEDQPGAVGAHFLLSDDGSRVVLWSEWTDPQAHRAAGEGGDRDEAYRVFAETPGVRPTRGRSYRLHRTLRR